MSTKRLLLGWRSAFRFRSNIDMVPRAPGQWSTVMKSQLPPLLFALANSSWTGEESRHSKSSPTRFPNICWRLSQPLPPRFASKQHRAEDRSAPRPIVQKKKNWPSPGRDSGLLLFFFLYLRQPLSLRHIGGQLDDSFRNARRKRWREKIWKDPGSTVCAGRGGGPRLYTLTRASSTHTYVLEALRRSFPDDGARLIASRASLGDLCKTGNISTTFFFFFLNGKRGRGNSEIDWNTLDFWLRGGNKCFPIHSRSFR